MKSILSLFVLVLALQGCSHPIDIVGEGDVLSASGDRDCRLEEHAAGAANCSENMVINDYIETYYATPRSGWQFHRWASYCVDDTTGECGFNIAAQTVQQFWGATASPLTAIFRPTVNTGLKTLLIGHSFFDPFARRVPFHALNAGFSDHTQSRFYSGGGSGAPQAFWESASKRAAIQAVLDGGDVDLFGMTFHPEYPTIEGYRNWVAYALQQNPDTRFFLAAPWAPSPGSTSSADYENFWHQYHPEYVHGFIDTLRAENPGVDFYCIPYGQSAVELRTLYSAGNLPDVNSLVSSSGQGIFRDSFGHAGPILEALGELVWLRAIYGVDLSTYAYDPGYSTDLKAIAQGIMDEHDPAYNAP
jgi:hypothetical protein